ncbi:MAG: hypothetical protein K2X60_01590 [Xanthobacteraceae bacterium]|nr:hypothetical protein [Xanthobacteraceae bacterium]
MYVMALLMPSHPISFSRMPMLQDCRVMMARHDIKTVTADMRREKRLTQDYPFARRGFAN